MRILQKYKRILNEKYGGFMRIRRTVKSDYQHRYICLHAWNNPMFLLSRFSSNLVKFDTYFSKNLSRKFKFV